MWPPRYSLPVYLDILENRVAVRRWRLGRVQRTLVWSEASAPLSSNRLHVAFVVRLRVAGMTHDHCETNCGIVQPLPWHPIAPFAHGTSCWPMLRLLSRT